MNIEQTPRRRAVAVVIRGEDILVIDRHRDGRRYVTFPAGGIEIGETEEAACLRELREEASVTGRILSKLSTVLSSSMRIPPAADMVNEIFIVEYVSGTPALSPDSPEGKKVVLQGPHLNTYLPHWMSIREFVVLENLLPVAVGEAVKAYLHEHI